MALVLTNDTSLRAVRKNGDYKITQDNVEQDKTKIGTTLLTQSHTPRFLKHLLMKTALFTTTLLALQTVAKRHHKSKLPTPSS